MIFVVDDDARIRAASAAALSDAGFDVEEFGSGLAALERAALVTPSLLITDVLMPEMNGPALAEAMRKRLPRLPVLFISGDVGDTPPSAFEDDPLLPKPFTAPKLILAVKGLLDA